MVVMVVTQYFHLLHQRVVALAVQTVRLYQ
jgi:hypothetical protein